MEDEEHNWIKLAFEKDNGNEDSTKESKSTHLENKVSNELKLEDKERLTEIRSIQKNLALIAVSGVLVTAPMCGLVNSTTSLLDDEGLGITSLAACSISQFLGSAFLLSYTNKVWGIKNMVSASLILPIPFILSYVYPSWWTTLPTGIFMGLGQAFITSIFMYGSALGYYYAKLTMGNSDMVLVAISGLLLSCIGGGLFFGNIILFAVLNVGSDDVNFTASMNVSYDICGVQYCNQELTHLPTMAKPEAWRYYTMVGIFSSMAILGGILTLFVRDFSIELGYKLRKKSEYLLIMKETLGLLKYPRGYLLIFFTVFVGLEEAFVLADYTHAFISCSIGIPKVGLIMLTYGGVQIVVCTSQGLFVKLFGRVPVVIFGTLLLMGCFLVIFSWHPDSEQIGIFFLIAVLWATGDGIIIPASFAMYGILFEDNIEGSLALGTFWWALGFMLAFVWSQFLCIAVKLYITISVGCVGLICYIILELMIRKKLEKTNEFTTDQTDKIIMNGIKK